MTHPRRTTRSGPFHLLAALLLAGLLLPGSMALPAAAEEPPSPGYQQQVEHFFATLDQGEYGAAIAKLYEGNPWISEEDLDGIRAQFESIPEAIGELHHRELLSEQHVTDRFVFLWYVGHFDRSPVSLYFKFYKPGDSWRFYSFEYKEDLGQIARAWAIDELKDESRAPSDDTK